MKIILLIIIFSIVTFRAWAEHPKREFRGMWIATVNNLDWPSKAGDKAEKQQEELIAILDTLANLNFNAVIFQIRPASDAFYRSKTEPWSAYLTGQQGKLTDKNWDPLAFVINECHKRGMELHAWMNPFRIAQKTSDILSEQNVAMKHPEWVVTYAGRQYLDPGIPDVRRYLKDIVDEVVNNYDIDAIHFDDYFYPYPVANAAFPDTLSFKNYGAGYTAENIDNWRRANVDSIISTLGKSIKSLKPFVKFGISPFGVWRNYDVDVTGSVTQGGASNYDHLFANVTYWQQMGWIDYLIPQIYWEIGHPKADYVTLANWWNEKGFDRHVYIGHALYKLDEGSSDAWKNTREIPEQIAITRTLKNIGGSAFFRMKNLSNNPQQIKTQLKKSLYPNKALVPPMKWIDNEAPAAPYKVVAHGLFRKKHLTIDYGKNQKQSTDHAGFLVYFSTDKNKIDPNNATSLILYTTENQIDIKEIPLPLNKKSYIWISAVDRLHNESIPVGGVKIKKKK